MATTECTAITRLIEDVQRQAIVEESDSQMAAAMAAQPLQNVAPMRQDRPAWRPQGAPAGAKRTLPPLPRNRAPSHTPPPILLEGSATAPVALEPIESMIETVSLETTGITAMPIGDEDVIEFQDDVAENLDVFEVDEVDEVDELDELDDVEVQPVVAGSVVTSVPWHQPKEETGPSVHVKPDTNVERNPMFAMPRPAAAPAPVAPAIAAVAFQPDAFAPVGTSTDAVSRQGNKKILAYGLGGVALFGAALGITSLLMKGGSNGGMPSAPATPSAAPVAQAAAVPVAVADQEPAAAAELGDTLAVADNVAAGAKSTFASDPAGATVTLIEAGVPRILGTSPVEAVLTAGTTYEVMFALPGHMTKLDTITVDSSGAAQLNVSLATLGGGAVPAIAETEAEVEAAPVADEPVVETKVAAAPAAKAEKKAAEISRSEPKSSDKSLARKAATASASSGTLLLGSKPPCEIYVDGKATGMMTPQRDIKLSAGKHKIKLVNKEHGINTTFSVVIKADEKTKVIKDMSSKL